jgi:hypothetical protein
MRQQQELKERQMMMQTVGTRKQEDDVRESELEMKAASNYIEEE